MNPPEKLKRGPKILRDPINALIDFVVATRPIKGQNTTISETSAGTAINAEASDSGPQKRTPWQPSGGATALVIGNGVLLADFRSEASGLTIANLGSTLSLLEGDMAWIEVTIPIDGSTPTTASLQSGSPGWYPYRVYPSPSAQTQLNIPLCQIISGVPVQLLSQNQTLIKFIISGFVYWDSIDRGGLMY